MKIRYEPLNKKALLFIWDRMRKRDKEEAKALGQSRKKIVGQLNNTEMICAYANGIPAAAFGFSATARCIYFFFFGTDRVTSHIKTLTKSSRSYVEYTMQQYPEHRALVLVWEKHTDARKWLAVIGFKPLSAYVSTKSGRFLYYEYH